MKTWYEQNPNRLQEELSSLEAIGIRYSVDEAMKINRRIRLIIEIDGNNPHFDFPDKTNVYRLVAVYPDLFPWFRPEVFAFEMDLPRHQHPGQKNLCLLPRPTENWEYYTLADLLIGQLSQVIEKGNVVDQEIIKSDPAEQAEPITDFYDYAPETNILFDHNKINVTPKIKEFSVIGKLKVGLREESRFPDRMAVIEILNDKGEFLDEIKEEIQKQFNYKFLWGTIIEAPEPPPLSNLQNQDAVLEWLKKGLINKGGFTNPNKISIKRADGDFIGVTAICFPMEIERGTTGNGWVFLIECLITEKDKNNKPIDGRSKKHGSYLSRPAFINSGVNSYRVPKLTALGNYSIAITGLGALGSFVAIELARSGVKELRLLDHDFVEMASTVRWPLGIPAAGLLKTKTLAKFIRENYPNTKVVEFNEKVGNIQTNGNAVEVTSKGIQAEIIERFLDGVSFHVDATTEEGTMNYLTDLCQFKKIPHVVMYGTPGAWGGLVMRCDPASTKGCWNCMRHWQRENEEELVPPADDKGMIQPPGCAEATFTGASFDMQQISLMAVRMVVSTLCEKEENGYSTLPWDFAVLRLVDKEHNPILPTWTQHKLNRHTDCEYCNRK